MTPQAVLSHPARVLTQEQREDYFSNGYVAVESLFGAGEVARIRAVVDEFVEKSRQAIARDQDSLATSFALIRSWSIATPRPGAVGAAARPLPSIRISSTSPY